MQNDSKKLTQMITPGKSFPEENSYFLNDNGSSKKLKGMGNHDNLALPCLMDPRRGLKATQSVYFSLFTHTKKLLKSVTDGNTQSLNKGETDVKSEIFI